MPHLAHHLWHPFSSNGSCAPSSCRFEGSSDKRYNPAPSCGPPCRGTCSSSADGSTRPTAHQRQMPSAYHRARKTVFRLHTSDIFLMDALSGIRADKWQDLLRMEYIRSFPALRKVPSPPVLPAYNSTFRCKGNPIGISAVPVCFSSDPSSRRSRKNTPNGNIEEWIVVCFLALK